MSEIAQLPAPKRPRVARPDPSDRESAGAACAAGPVFLLASDVGSRLQSLEAMSWREEMKLWMVDLSLVYRLSASAMRRRFRVAAAKTAATPEGASELAPASTPSRG